LLLNEFIEQKEYLYDKYKDGLKLVSVEEYNEAESLFETLLNSTLMSEEFDKDNIEKDKELVNLKYILFKNLASINGSKKKNYEKALDYLIQVNNLIY
jgi:hypothetical protein